jgi:PIN domain nuclease of toxin-antitoxin system
MMLARKNRVTFSTESQRWVETASNLPGFQVMPLSAEIAILAGSESLSLHGDPADRFIAATAIEHEIPLVTCDETLRQHERLQTIW